MLCVFLLPRAWLLPPAVFSTMCIVFTPLGGRPTQIRELFWPAPSSRKGFVPPYFSPGSTPLGGGLPPSRFNWVQIPRVSPIPQLGTLGSPPDGEVHPGVPLLKGDLKPLKSGFPHSGIPRSQSPLTAPRAFSQSSTALHPSPSLGHPPLTLSIFSSSLPY